MKKMDWSAAGLSASECRLLDQLATGDAQFTISQLVGLWQQSIHELETGQRWVREDYLNALDVRDDLEDVLPFVPVGIAQSVFRVVDALDRKFRDATAAASTLSDPSRWWRCRVPIGNSQRLYLFEKVNE